MIYIDYDSSAEFIQIPKTKGEDMAIPGSYTRAQIDAMLAEKSDKALEMNLFSITETTTYSTEADMLEALGITSDQKTALFDGYYSSVRTESNGAVLIAPVSLASGMLSVGFWLINFEIYKITVN